MITRKVPSRLGARHDAPLPWYCRPSGDAWGVRHLPEIFLIGPDGRVRASRIPNGRLRDEVAAALRP
jgi:hypothetical protein